jgi:hypothetical protein
VLPNGTLKLTKDVTVPNDQYTFLGAKPSEIAQLSGTKRKIQTQLDELDASKQPKGNYALASDFRTLQSTVNTTNPQLSSNITSLQTQLNSKQPKGDYALASDITTLQSALNDKQPKGDYATMTDLQENVDNLEGNIGGVFDAVNALSYTTLPLSGGTLTGNLNGITPTQLGYLTMLTGNMQTQLNGKQASGSYALASDITSLQTALNG